MTVLKEMWISQGFREDTARDQTQALITKGIVIRASRGHSDRDEDKDQHLST